MAFKKSEMKRIDRMHGNGAVYATDGRRVFEYLVTNFDIATLYPKGDLDLFVDQDEVIISCGGGTTKEGALRALELVKRRIEAIPQSDFNPYDGDGAEVAKRHTVDCWPDQKG